MFLTTSVCNDADFGNHYHGGVLKIYKLSKITNDIERLQINFRLSSLPINKHLFCLMHNIQGL